MFTVPAVEALLDQLRKNPRVEQEDLTVFQAWLNSMPRRNMYNIACLFMLDEDGQVRICLHPKNVASNLEVSILPNHNVSEAEFVAVVTLESVDPAFQEVNIQPLICSDALDLRTSRPGPNPIATISLEPGRVIPNAPDHIDIVSIATCTPQRDEERENLPGNESLAWQPKFRTTFVAASINAHYIRHAFATFIMSNFRIGPGNVPGGLSGGFIPARPPNERESVEGVRTWVWGKEGPRDHSWRLLDGAKVEDWKSDGQLATLHPDRPDEPEIARVFGLTIPLMLRNQNRFAPAMGLTDFVVIPIPAVASIDATIPLEAPDV